MDQNYAQQLLFKVKNDYNQTAEEFSRTRQFFWPEMEKIFDCIKPSNKVLDFGCGNARALPYIQQKGGEYFGVDISENLIKIARQKYPQANLRIIYGNILPFEDNFFDIAYAIAVFHNIPSKELRSQILREIKRVLKPNGFLILTVWQPKNKRFFWLFCKYSILKACGFSKMDFRDLIEKWGVNGQRYFHLFSKVELKKMALENGWQVVKNGVVKNERGNRNNIYLICKKCL